MMLMIDKLSWKSAQLKCKNQTKCIYRKKKNIFFLHKWVIGLRVTPKTIFFLETHSCRCFAGTCQYFNISRKQSRAHIKPGKCTVQRGNVGPGQGRRSQNHRIRHCWVILCIYSEPDFSDGFLLMSYSKTSKILINLISLILIPCSPSNHQLMKLNQMDFTYLWSVWLWFLEVN